MADFDALVAGDAAITFAWQVSAAPTPGLTSKLLGEVEPEARFGGCAPGVALALTELGHRVALVSWLGDDRYGCAYLEELRSHGIDTAGVEVAAGQASPRALMLYDPDGRATCLHHPSGSGNLALSAAGRERLQAAHWLVLTAGPAPMSAALLDAKPSAVRIAWDVKADPSHYPIDLRRRIVRDAELLIFNREELGFLLEAAGGDREASLEQAIGHLRAASPAVLVLTDGPDGSCVYASGREIRISARRVEVDDPTGVGDAFFSAFLSAMFRGKAPADAGQAATDYAARFLIGRRASSALIPQTKESTA